jgi:methionyl-tRNA synthetase
LPDAAEGPTTPPKRALVTSALPYANGHVHIGHLAGAYLPADVYVRYLRARGCEVAFICGSDEHGVPATIAADREGVTPREIIDRYHPANGAAFEAARVEFDYWGRTSSERHHENSQYFFKRLHEGGHISKKESEQLYCAECGRFLADRYVEGTCHHCGRPGARGDQCDKCGRLIDALKLGEPKCKICGSAPEMRKTIHWYFKLGDFQDRLTEWLESKTKWRMNVRQGAMGWLKEGLRERAITRDLTWGIKVPLDDPDAEGKVLYVWFDAPVGYLTFTQQWAEEKGAPDSWEAFWRDPECPIAHFIGKDNIAFHAITWPAMLMGADDGTQLPASVVANEYLNLGEGKFSKSLGRVIRIADFAREFGSDALRYHITTIAPESSDSEFTWEDFRQKYSDLAGTLGNLCHRGLTFASKRMGGRFPPTDKLTDADREALALVRSTRDAAGASLLRFRFKEALSHVMELARAGNRHFDERAPWQSRKTDMPDCEAAIAASLGIVRGLATLVWPFLPEAAERLARSFGAAAPEVGPASWDSAGQGDLPAGAELGEPEVLFPKLDDAEFAAKVGRVTASED